MSYEGLNVKMEMSIYSICNLSPMQEEDLEDLYEDLIKYCRLDTWAMEVSDGLRRLVS